MKNLRLSKILLIMKISTLLLFLICINISAVTFSQKFSFEVKGETIKDILAMIEGTSDYKFLYRSDLIDVNSQISLDVNNENIQSILDRIFDPDKTAFRIIDDYLIVISQKIGNQQQNVTGQITDAYTGEPMPGVFVIIEGTTIGVTTDAKGDYVLPRPESEAIVLFSFIGYTTQKVTYNNENVINIQLTRDVLSLEEVVVVGYGTLRKRDLTGAVARSDLSTLENSPNVNVLQSLKGIVPGLNIGAVTRAGDSPSISIRGQNSISGTTSPLIVLDGIIYRGDLVDINPNDIESIDVLKDASSAAIYGSQGANGVLLITTKTSKQMSKPIIEYSGQITLQSLINKDMERLDRDGFLSQIADIFISQSRMGTDLLQINPDFDPVPYFKYPGATTGYYDGTNVDWWDLLSNPQPFIQSHNLSLRGKNEQASYFVSFGYSDQKNIAINDAYKRYSFRVNLDTKVTNWLKVGTQSYFNLSDFSGIDPGFSNLCSMPALVNPYNADGTLIEIPYSGSTNPLLIIDNPNTIVR
jgi:TonB-linked SusC/RagA family outer membrane protein